MINAIESHKTTKNGRDWHRADIIAELKKRGTSLSKLSIEAGLSPRTLNNALDRSYPKAEKIIANAIGVKPSDIWKSRYTK
ncbi:helix-turn-helix domain-containing protein [Mannheimia sp. AT1]|uniref:Helix-turn-helix domain-containing protein n=1 Tax=Mannheimia cairinae TaxID=3025936 RepID=A0ABT5MNG4_9PAST|nr:helix-turn-helix domain-containing protein [Mannheimia cairinae]MDD0825342.1 helix-turn-helix domain-containing protein [Mannheimia cairinae]